MKTTVVASAFIHRSDTFLIARRSFDDDFLPGYWEMPGGKSDDGEDPRDAVVREIKEEVGIDVDPLLPAAVRSYKNKNVFYVEIFFVCRIKDEKQEVVLSEEHSEYKWVTFEDVSKFETTEYVEGVLEEIQKLVI